jgi:hypothetical protein
MIRSSPVLPLIGGGTTKFQPVFVGDMAAGLLSFSGVPIRPAKPTNLGDLRFTASKCSWNSCSLQ